MASDEGMRRASFPQYVSKEENDSEVLQKAFLKKTIFEEGPMFPGQKNDECDCEPGQTDPETLGARGLETEQLWSSGVIKSDEKSSTLSVSLKEQPHETDQDEPYQQLKKGRETKYGKVWRSAKTLYYRS